MPQSDRTVPLLSLSDVGKSYALGRSMLARFLNREHVHAVAGLSFDVAAGYSLAIVG